jgi:general secretion pathway protein N
LLIAAIAGVSTMGAFGPAYSQSNEAVPAVVGSPESRTEPARAGNPLREVPISKLSATRDRPLFSSSRRPPPEVVAAPPPQPAATVKPAVLAAPPFTLVGTIIGEDNRIGIFFNETSKITTRIRLGEVDSGWTLRSIEPRSAVLEGNGRMVILNLPEASATAAPGPRVSRVVKKRNPRRNDGDGL